MIDQHNTIAEKFIKKWFWLYLFSFIIAPTGYLIKIILSWDISVSEMWILYWAMSLMLLLTAFNDFWMTESLHKFIPDFITQKNYDKVKSTLFYAFMIQLVTWIVIFCLFYFWAGWFAEHFFKEWDAMRVIQIFAFFFLGYNFFQVLNTFFLAVQNTFVQKLTEFCRWLFVLGFIFVIFIFDLGSIELYSWSWVLGLYLWIILSFVWFYKKYYLPYLKESKILYDKELFFTLLKYGFFVFLWAQVSTIVWQIDMQMIIFLLWTQDAWYYSNYLSLIWIPFVVIGPIFSFIFPVFSEMYAKNENDKIMLVKKILQKNFISIGLAFNILFFVFATTISVILFGEKFLQSWVILQYSILFLIFNFLLQINFSILAAIWQVKWRLYIMIVALIFNAIMNIILIKILWVVGSALATWIGWVLIWGATEIVLKWYRVRFDFLDITKNLVFLSSLWVGLHFYILPLFTNLNRIESFFFFWIISLIYFWLFLLLNKGEFRYFFDEVKRFRKK